MWPPLLAAAALWLVWAVSAQFPFTLRPDPHVYATLQRGCIGCWVWAPAERPTLGISDHLDFTAQRTDRLVHTPFLWCDRWGFGIGGPVWYAAAIATVITVRRYTMTTVRDAPPLVRCSRRKAAAWTGAWCIVTLGMAVSAGHRNETFVRIAGVSLSVENGALVLGQPEAPGPSAMFTAIPVAGFSPTTVVVKGPASRQGSLSVDLLPDYSSDTVSWRAALPLWPLVLVFGWLGRRSLATATIGDVGFCAACGYSLAGLSGGSACPECGFRDPAAQTGPPNTPRSNDAYLP